MRPGPVAVTEKVAVWPTHLDVATGSAVIAAPEETVTVVVVVTSHPPLLTFNVNVSVLVSAVVAILAVFGPTRFVGAVQR